MVHIDDVAGIIERICTLVDHIYVAMLVEHIADSLQSIEVVHWLRGAAKLGCHFGAVLALNFVDGIAPLLAWLHGATAQLVEHERQRGADVTHHGGSYRAVAVNLGGIDIEL